MIQIEISEIKNIEARVQRSDEYVSLSQGALKVGGIPQAIKEHLRTVLTTDQTDYYQSAWGIMPLREKIASHLSLLHETKLSSDNILVTHGCMGAISIILLTLLDHGDEVLLPEPTYPAYKSVIGFARGKVVYIPAFDGDNSLHWHINLERLEAMRTNKTKMLLFSNPCNPAGVTVSREKLEELVTWCEKHGIYLVVDESYDDYIFDNSFFSSTSLVARSEFVIRAGSYSKNLSMSGWRVGFMVVPKSLSCVMGVSQDALLNCPNVPAQHAVLYALDHPEHTKHFHTIVKQNRDDAVLLLQPLVERNILSFQKPHAGFYLFLKTQEEDSFDLCMSILQQAKVGLIPGRAFGPTGKSFLRLCYARKPEVLQEGIKRIKNYFL